MAAGASLELRVPRRRQGGLEGWQAVGEAAKGELVAPIVNSMDLFWVWGPALKHHGLVFDLIMMCPLNSQ